MHCININHPDYQFLLENSGVSSTLLKAKISIWMDKYGTNSFPTLDQLDLGTDLMYQRPGGRAVVEEAKRIYFDEVFKKDPDKVNVELINQRLRQISDRVGDVPWNLRMSKKGNYYVAGYKNRPVTMDDYYSPFAQGFFRQLRSQSTEFKIEKLDKKLINWAKKHDISVVALKSAIEKFPDRYEKSALGVADFAKNLIAIADGSRLDTMAEEVGHFAVEILLQANDPSIQRAINNVSETNTYAAVKEEYKDLYKDEIDFRKEALGKLIAAEIVTQFKMSNTMSNESGFWQSIKNSILKFLNYIASKLKKGKAARRELDSIIIPLADSILAEEKLGKFSTTAFTKKDIKYQVEPTSSKNNISKSAVEEKEKFVNKAIENLDARIELLKGKTTKAKNLHKLNREIKNLQALIEKSQIDLAITSFVALAEEELDTVIDTMNNSIENNTALGGNNINLIEGFIEMYQNIFNGITSDFISVGVPKEEREKLSENFKNVADKLNRATALKDSIGLERSVAILDKGNTDAYGNKIDPNQNSREIAETAVKDAVGYWRLNAGNFKYADSSIITSALKLIHDQIGKVQRFANRLGNEIFKSQEQFLKKYKQKDLVEKDENGKLTHHLIKKHNMTAFYTEKDAVKKEIAEKLGYKNDADEFSYNSIPFENLNADERKYLRERWVRFDKENTTIEYVTDDSGEVLEMKVPNKKYINKEFEEKYKDPVFKAHYDLLIKKRTEALQKLPERYRTERILYTIPPIMKSTVDTLFETKGFLKKISQLTDKAFFVDADDTQFGQLNLLNNKMVPIYFTGTLEDTQDLSYDLGKSFVIFGEMAENFKEMSEIAGDMQVLQSSLAKREFIKKGVKTTYQESKEYQALEHLIDTNIFNIEREIIGTKITEDHWLGKMFPDTVGKEFSWTKVSQTLSGFVRTNNLAFNFVSSMAGWFKASIDKVVEEQTGLYTNHDSATWAKLEFAKNIGQVLLEIGKVKQTNKMHLLLQDSGIVSLDRMLHDTGRGRLTRKLLNKDLVYTTFQTGDYGIKGRVTLSVYDNHRLYKGQFINRTKFYEITAAEQNVENDGVHQKRMKKEWKDLREKSLYNAYEVIDGQLKVKKEFKPYVTDAVLNSVRGIAHHISSTLDGVLGEIDKGVLSRKIVGDWLLMHKGWAIQLIDTRLRKQTVNKLSGEEEIGAYRASTQYLKDIFFNEGKLSFAPFAMYKKLTPARKRGVIRTGLDFVFLVIVSLIAAAINLRADDEPDNWLLNLMAYQTNRLLLEQNAAWSIGEFVEMIDEPIAGSRKFKEWADIFEFFSGEEIERGMYKGKKRWQKQLLKQTPFKNLYEIQYPDQKNNFTKSILKSKIYEDLSDKEKVGLGDMFFNWLLPYNDANYWDDMTDEEREEDLDYLIDEMAQDEMGEYNGFN